jgi:glycerate 2-kinase
VSQARAVACPASLKGVLSASQAAAALADGLRRTGAVAEEVPVADGGEGTADVVYAAVGGAWHTASVSDALQRPVSARFLVLPDGKAIVESAEVIGLPQLREEERDPLCASSRGLGELILAAAAAGARSVLVCLGGSATVDGGAGLREVLDALPVQTTVAHDVQNPLLGERGAARAFGPQKGASPEVVDKLERRLRSMAELAPVRDLPGAGAAGGLGAALAALGAALVPGADLVLDTIGFRARIRGAALAVTGEGTVDRTTPEGKAPSAVFRACRLERIRCAVFGGRVVEPLPEAEIYELPSGRRAPRPTWCRWASSSAVR